MLVKVAAVHQPNLIYRNDFMLFCVVLNTELVSAESLISINEISTQMQKIVAKYMRISIILLSLFFFAHFHCVSSL